MQEQVFTSIEVLRSLCRQCLQLGFFKEISDANIAFQSVQTLEDYVRTTGKNRNPRKDRKSNSAIIPPGTASAADHQKEAMPTGTGKPGTGKPGTGKAGSSKAGSSKAGSSKPGSERSGNGMTNKPEKQIKDLVPAPLDQIPLELNPKE